MRSIKILDIGYISIIYIIVALSVSKTVDNILGEFDEMKERENPFWRKSIELAFTFWLYGVLIYVVRNVVERIPFPLHGYQGFDHYRVRELGSAAVFSISFMIFNNFVRSKVSYYYENL